VLPHDTPPNRGSVSHPANGVDPICGFAGEPLLGGWLCKVDASPRFYFSVAGRMAIADHNGENLPSLVDAMQEAIEVPRTLPGTARN
jgi:hypothetical protein